MNIECKIIQDILPLYAENMVSDETKTFVEEHLADCENCRDLLEKLKETTEISIKLEAVPLEHLRKRLLKKQITIVLFTVAAALALATGFAFLTTPHYLPYSEDILSFSEPENGSVRFTFSEKVTGFIIQSDIREDGKLTVNYISAWTTTWNELFSTNDNQPNFVWPAPTGEQRLTVYFAQNNGAEDILIYGEPFYENGGVISLPRLVLGYYLAIALIACIVSAVLLFIFRSKQTARLWIEKFLIFTVSYLIGHVFIKGFTTATYSLQRDFSLILFVSILIYLACLFGIYLYRARKESKIEQ